MRQSIRYRLLLIFIGLALVPLLVVSALLGQRIFQTLEEDALDGRRSSAALVKLEVEDFIQDREQELVRLGTVQRITRFEVEEQEILLNNLMAYEQAYQDIALVDQAGQEQVRVLRGEFITPDDLVNRAESATFQRVMASQGTVFSAVAFDPVLREPLVTIAVPFFDLQSSEVSAVLIAEVRFKAVWDLLAGLELEQDEDVFITDGLGQVIAHQNPSVVLSNTAIDLTSMEGRRSGLSGETVLFASEAVQFGDQELVVISEQSLASALALATNSVTITALITASALVVALILVFLVIRWVARPIEGLSQTARQLAKGDYAVRSTLTRQDEFGELAASFNQMAEAIEVRDEAIRSQSDKLTIALVEAKESSRLKTEFLSTMSHELRTPLNSILGFASMMRMGMRGETDDLGRNTLVRIQDSGEHLLGLINDVLDIAKIEAGRLELVSAPLSMTAMVSGWQHQVEVLAQEKGLALETHVDPNMPGTVLGDEERLTQIAINLLSNAVKFTESGTVKLDISKAGHEQWRIRVCDTGIGIPLEAQEYIFDEFRQVDGSSSRAFGGTGLGLPIVKRLAVAMGGAVQVESTRGQGSVFTVTLPLNTVSKMTSLGV